MKEIDVLIVFADADNQGDQGMVDGWVDQFKENLELVLGNIADDMPKILLKADYDSLTGINIAETNALIIINSDHFAQAEGCHQTINEFCDHYGDDAFNRIFKVNRIHIPTELHHTSIVQFPGYEFYHADTDTDEIYEYATFSGTDTSKEYWSKMADLCFDVLHVIGSQDQSEARIVKPTTHGGKTIYLAYTTPDLTVERSVLKRLLTKKGHRILPEDPCPSEANKIIQQIEECLQQCDMSIHLIGELYGDVIDGLDKSVVDLQCSLSFKNQLKREAKEGYSSYLWLSPKTMDSDASQLAFVETLKREASGPERGEVFDSSFEEFKTVVTDELSSDHNLPGLSAQTHTSNGKKSVYFLYHPADTEQARKYVAGMVDHQLDVLIAPENVAPFEARRYHINYLTGCDMIVIYSDQSSRHWIQTKLLDVVKSPGYGRKNVLPTTTLILSKELGDVEQWQKLLKLDILSEDVMKPAQILDSVGELSAYQKKD